MSKINILGTKYDYIETTDLVDDRLIKKDGYCDMSGKTIAVEINVIGDCKKLGRFKKKVKRHEIIHAYFFESGLTEYADNELIVDWIAVQFPKLLKTFQEVDAI